MSNEIKYFKQFFISMIVGFTILIATSLSWNITNERKTTYELAKVEALGNYNKDLAFRKWASMHGGVYVPITDSIVPNPYLEFVKERNITTNTGQILTLINPAYMTRLVFQIGAVQYGEKGHITSLHPLNPKNKADEWETNALKMFQDGKQEYSSIENINNENHLRYMKPLVIENSCIKCHANQGYKIGDIRGGISVAIPMKKYKEILKVKINNLILTHSIIYLLLLLIGSLSYRRILMVAKQKNDSQKRVIQSEAILKEQNNKLIVANQKAIESDRLKTIFLQNMSHEIRTPMNAILGFSSLLPQEFNNKIKLSEYTNIISQRGKDLLYIISDLLDISKIESENIALHTEQFLLNDLITELTPTFCEIQKRYDKAHLELKLPNTEKSNNIILFTDKGKLKQVITNLVNNAFKFTDKGYIKVDLKVETNGLLTFYIKDTGIGIPETYHKSIFNRFSQVEQNADRIYGGTGLGLSIVKGLVEKLGGEIHLQSLLQRGSLFYFTIPISHSDEDHLKLENRKSSISV